MLPPDLVATRPVEPRSAARLLVAEETGFRDMRMRGLPELLRAGDLLVINDTRVIPARLRGERHRDSRDGSGSARLEVTLIQALPDGHWRAFARPLRRLRVGDVIRFSDELRAEVRERGENDVTLRMVSDADLTTALERAGEMPLPPYIESRRKADARDLVDYQTVFAARPGAVAAPTAALHFDAELLAALAAKDIGLSRITLHVGAGTFLPVKVENIDTHRMHAEWGEIGPEAAAAINAARAAGGRVIAVGTTVMRLLESATAEDGRIAPWSGETDIFIRPGFRFRAVDGLITNFHLPRSTLLMLVAAFIGFEHMQALYAHAVDARYRFFSYGDGSLLWRRAETVAQASQ